MEGAFYMFIVENTHDVWYIIFYYCSCDLTYFSHFTNSCMQFLLGVNKDQSTFDLDLIQLWLIRCYYTYSRKVNY